jgi:hypothetical protein
LPSICVLPDVPTLFVLDLTAWPSWPERWLMTAAPLEFKTFWVMSLKARFTEKLLAQMLPVD